MKFLEKDLEGIIYDTYRNNKCELRDRGLHIYGDVKRQLRIGNYGILDLLTACRMYEFETEVLWNEDSGIFEQKEIKRPLLRISVYELKKDKVGISAFLQCYNYIKGLKDWFKKHKPEMNVSFDAVLIGRELDTSGSFCFLPDLIGDLQIYTYSYDIDGLKFNNECGYSLTNKGF